MTRVRLSLLLACAAITFTACSRAQPATSTQATTPAPMAGSTSPATALAASPPPAATPASAGPAPAASAANGYSCTFQGPARQAILARFSITGATAQDDQGLGFTVLANSPTALVLAHARDDLATVQGGDIGAYVVAIDRRTLEMVQTTVGLNGQSSTRRGRCIAG